METRPRSNWFSILAFILICILIPCLSLYAQMGGGMVGGGGTMSGMGVGSHSNLMGNGMGGMMLLSGGKPYHTDGTPITLNEGIFIARSYLATRQETNLALDEIEEWEFNFYVVVKETDSSNKAFQLIIDKYTGSLMPEPGPNMMWNTKYPAGNRRMEIFSSLLLPTTPMTIGVDAATKAANDFLKSRFPALNLVAVAPPDVFYGYYTFDVNDAGGNKYGMLSVNGTTGQVWYHTWHGSFIQGREITQ